MITDFQGALDKVAQDPASIPYRTLALLSGPSRAERAAFGRWWDQLPAEARRAIVTRMFELVEESFELDFNDLFRHCLTDADATVRYYAIEGLWEDERADLVAPLLRIVAQDPESNVRAAAASALGRFLFMCECEELDPHHGATIREALEQIVLDRSQPVAVARRALESLAHINDERIRGLIDWAYEQGDEELRVSAIFAMGRSAEPAWALTVLEELNSTSLAIRYEAARACGEIQIKQAVEPLIALTDSRDRDIQLAAIWSLGQIGGDRAREALDALADGSDEGLAEAALEAVEELEFSTRDLALLEHDADRLADANSLAGAEDQDLDEDEDQDEEDGDDADDLDPQDDWEDEALDLEDE
jgi:HEAT repeat protein